MKSAFDRYAKPGERHAALAPLIGRWAVAMTTHAPDGSSTRSDDVRAVKTWFGDGRYVREDVDGTFGGIRHEKLTILGFNNIRERYEYTTADNHDAVVTFYITAPGADIANRRRIEVFTDYVDAGQGEDATGALVVIRTLIEIVSDDHHTLRNFYKAPGREEYLFLQYDYRRTA